MAKVVAGDAEAGGGSSWPSVLELEALMGERDMAALEALVKAKGGSGGVAGLMAILGTPSSGLDGSDVAQRRAFFGKNAFDAKPPTTYFELWWDAMHDGAIIVLGRLGEGPLHVSYVPGRRRRRKSHSVPSTGRPASRRGVKRAFETRDQPTAAAARSTYASPCA